VTIVNQITPLVLTYNEAPNIQRTLSRLTWASRIVVVDSFSTDETCDIVKRFKQAEVVQREFDTFAGQCNFGLQQICTPWVLSLDADYVLDTGFEEELAALQPDADVAGYRAAFTYCIHGRRLRASLYPPRTVLYRKERARYRDEGHGHRVRIEGRVLSLRSRILHDDRKPLERWFAEQDRYAQIEARHLLRSRGQGAGSGELNAADRVRRLMVVAPWLVCFYTLFAKGLIFEGWPGWHYVLQRTLAEAILSLRLIEARLRGRT
jgi:glycosyltransferase involved in cell wall biosynthesis